MLVLGLMSGTSLDGVDAALVEFDEAAYGGRGGAVAAGEPGTPSGAAGCREDEVAAGVVSGWALRAFMTISYSPAQRESIHRVIVAGGAAELCRLHVELGEWLAAAALQLCAEAGVPPESVDLIGSHGQTVWHEPPAVGSGVAGRGALAGSRGSTLQLGCPATIAERTGIPVVSDFRARDMAAGGEGAPLVPWVDRELFSVPGRRRILLNIGGMANLTWLPARGDSAPLLAFDTGPGNALIDAAVALATGGAESYDRGGGWASSGQVDEGLLTELLAHPFFARTPPKSTGRELFGRPFVEDLAARIGTVGERGWADIVATLTALTARSISGAIERWILPWHGVDEVVVTGGGLHNPVLLSLLTEQLAPIPLFRGEVLGVDPDAKEAVAFAVLARAHLLRVPANVPEVTGAAGPRVLGSYTPGRTGT
jgi:anhydro-N-acetylmuramic acid kinase